VGSLLSNVALYPCIERLGHRPIITAGGIAMGALLALVPFFPNIIMYHIFMLLIGFADNTVYMGTVYLT
jgi:uncharacterized protein (DUF2062 family)